MILISILICSAAIHISYILQLKETPYISHPLIDAEVYHQKALNILNSGWIGEKIFFQAPLYPYLLAIIYSQLGPIIENVIWIQAICSVFNVYLIFCLGRNLFDVETGLASAGLALFYGGFVLYSAFLLKATFSILFTCLFLLFFLQSSKFPSFNCYFKTGLFLGLCITLRGNFLLVFAALTIWIVFSTKKIKHNFLYGAGFVLGVIFIIFPITLRNYYLEEDFVLINYDAGPSYFIGNNARSTGMYHPFNTTRPHPIYERKDFTSKAEKVLGRKLKPSEVSRYWFKMSFHYILEKPGEWAVLQFKKLLIFINNYEKADNYNYQFIKSLIPSLNLAFIPFGFIFAASMTAIVTRPWKEKQFQIFYIFITVYSLSVIMFYVNSRYRLPLVPALLPFAGWFLARGLSSAFKTSGFFLLVTLLIVAFFLYASFRTQHKYNFLQAHLNYGGILEVEGKSSLAELQFRKALSLEPDSFNAHFNLATSLEKQGRIDDAIRHYQLTLFIRPEHPQAKNNLAAVYIKRGHLSKAKRLLLEVLKLRPGYADAHYNLGIIYNYEGKTELAGIEFKLTRKLDLHKTIP